MKKIPLHEIRLGRDAFDTEAEQLAIRQELQKLKLYGTQFAYTAVPPIQLPRLLRTGVFERRDAPEAAGLECCFVSTERVGIWKYPGQSLLDELAAATESEVWAPFAVYRKDKLRESASYWTFTEPQRPLDALVAVVKVMDLHRDTLKDAQDILMPRTY